MKEKELKNNEKLKNKKSTKSCSTLISNHQHLISDHKGITLIALVITIIVMLILVGVTVTVALNGGLFSQAKEATKKTQLEVDRESLLSVVLGCIGSEAEVDFDELNNNLPEGFKGNKEDGYTSKSGNTFYVDKYGNVSTQKTEGGSGQGGTEPDGGGTSSSGTWTLASDGNTATSGEATVNIGDYVNYTPTSSTYSLDKLGVDYTGYANTSTLETDLDLKWRILGVDEKGCLIIISDKPTSKTVYFKGAKGYNNGVYILNDICKTLYSSTELGVNARSLKIEDVEAGFSQEGINARDSFSDADIQYNQPYTYRRSSTLYPAIYAEENGSGIGVDLFDQDEGIKKNGIGVSDPYYKEAQLTGKTESYTAGGDDDQETKALTCTQNWYVWNPTLTNYCKNSKFYEMIFSTSTNYWLASRCVGCNDGYAGFGLRDVNDKRFGAEPLFYSEGSEWSDDSNFLRPVVSLGPDITLTTCSGTNNDTNQHTLSKASS